jgi:flagellar motor switch protein FliG
MGSIPAQLRKAAILVSALDDAAADALLDQLSEAEAQRVRMVLVELEDVDAAEQAAVIREFLGPRATKLTDSTAGVELELSTASRRDASSPRRTSGQTTTTSAQPFEFLSQAAAEQVAPHLMREHPQTIAVVLAHLPPRRAAEIVQQLPVDVQTEVLTRVGRIEEMNSDVVRDVERGLEAVLAHELKTTRMQGAGVAALEAILAASGEQRSHMVDRVALHDRQLAQQIQQEEKETPRQTARESTRPAPKAAPTPELHLRQPALPRETPPTVKTPKATVATVEFGQLQMLDDLAWARVLRAADSQVALLALAGAPASLVQRLLRQLPPREARTLERKMEQLGPVRLRDIERAQQQLARIAAELAALGEIRLPRPRAFATAA